MMPVVFPMKDIRFILNKASDGLIKEIIANGVMMVSAGLPWTDVYCNKGTAVADVYRNKRLQLLMFTAITQLV